MMDSKMAVHQDVALVRNGVHVTTTGVMVRFEVESADEVWIHVDGMKVELEKMPGQEVDSWSMVLEGQFHQSEYLVEIIREGVSLFSIDPWASSANENSRKGVMLDMNRVNPLGWETFQPVVSTGESVIYETHVRDFSVHDSYDSKEKGFFNRLGDESASGIRHLKELGVTHLHLLPIFDFTSVDDANIEGTYNWGYDPYLFNSPEGSYSSDPSKGIVRVKELKNMIQTLHDNGIAIVMDVVYNHTSHERHNPLHIFFPSFAYRKYATGEWGNGSGCGNELNTEHPVIRNFIIESLLFWQEQYHIDGFRFDLMALYDQDTVYAIEKALREVHPEVLLYGEPWTGGVSALQLEKQFLKGKQWDTKVALFNDEFRNGIKGDNDGHQKGLIAGNEYEQMSVLRGMVGSIQFNDWLKGFAKDPLQSVNYVSAHDNLGLFDKIEKSCPEFAYQDRIRLNQFALSVLMTAQGIPFLSQGSEFLYTKKGHHNAYNAGDEVNAIDWNRKEINVSVFDFTRDLIRLRKDQTALRMVSANEVRKRTTLLINEHKLIGLSLKGELEGDYEEMLVLHNFNGFNHEVDLPEGEWLLLCYDASIDLSGMEWVQGHLQLPYYSTTILVKL